MIRLKINLAGVTVVLILLALLAAGCSTPPAGGGAGEGGQDRGSQGGVSLSRAPRIAVLLTADNLEWSEFAEEIMIGVSRAAQEFDGTITGREETIVFGEEVEFEVIATDSVSGAIEEQVRELDPHRYDLVFGCGFQYSEPLSAVHRDYPRTHFVIVDGHLARDDPGDNITVLQFKVRDASFLAGVVAADKFRGDPLGFVGGLDIPLIRDEFLGGFAAGVEYADSLNGTNTELLVEFADGFGSFEQGYELARSVYQSGAVCVYQAAGSTGYGVIEAAADLEGWVIGVDIDQGLQLAGDPEGRWILTSVVKRWGTGVYLVCREFLVTGAVPSGAHVVGLAEGCVDLAINPYNTPYLVDQLELIASVRSSLERGEIPSAVAREETEVWRAGAAPAAGERIPLAVNDPEFSPGIDVSYAPTLQKALSTAFHESGRYRVISREQKGRLLEEISSSLDLTADEKQQLEVGRLIAAKVIVFVDLSRVGESYILDAKVVDVQTGIALSAASESFGRIEEVFEGLAPVVRSLSAY